MTGPGPEAGARNIDPKGAHPIFPDGAKFGGLEFSCAELIGVAITIKAVAATLFMWRCFNPAKKLAMPLLPRAIQT